MKQPAGQEANSSPEIRLRRLKINRFRNVSPTELVFDDQWNVLLGKNGTGKTTLLELIAAVMRGDLSALPDIDYDIEAEIALGPAMVHWSVRRLEDASLQQAHQADPAGSKLLVPSNGRQFEAKIELKGLGGITMTGDERGPYGFPRTQQAISRCGAPAPFLLLLALGYQGPPAANHGPRALAVAAAASSGDVQRFDEALTFFERLGPTGDLTVSTHAHESKLATPEIVEAVESSFKHYNERVSVPHEKLPFLARFVELSNFKSASFNLELLLLKSTESKSRAIYGRPSFLFRLPNGDEIREQHLSFGQKRLLSFLYYRTVSMVVVADELVDGLHFDWISACIEESRGAQKFFASQNPLLVDHMGFKTQASVASRFIRCTLEGSQMIWANFSEREAEDFFVAYKTGIGGVSEVLRQKGLW